MSSPSRVKMAPDRLEIHLLKFDEELSRLAKAILESQFDLAEDICRSIESRAKTMRLTRLIPLCADFRQVLRRGETWPVLHHFINEFRRTFIEVIVPLKMATRAPTPVRPAMNFFWKLG